MFIAGMLAITQVVPAAAETVTLTGVDGSTSILGELISFENGIFTVLTAIGQMQVSADLVLCEGDGCPQAAPDDSEIDVRVAGSSSVGKQLIPAMLTGYASQLSGAVTNGGDDDPFVAIYHLSKGGSYSVDAGGADLGFDNLLNKTAEIVASSRRILPFEARALRDDDAGNMVSFTQEHVIAMENLMVVVHPSNGVSNISSDDLAKVYRGEITNWSDLGGADAPISVLAADDDTGMQDFFGKRMLTGYGAIDDSGWIKLPMAEDIAGLVADDTAAIGYVGAASAGDLKSLEVVGACGIVYHADAFGAKTEGNPLSRRIYAYNRADVLSSAGANFLTFAMSPASDAAVDTSGYVSLAVTRTRQTETENRIKSFLQNIEDLVELADLRTMQTSMAGWDRLSTTLRFISSSDRLDNKAELDITRLIGYLEGQAAGTRVSIVGFTDSDGPLESNKSTSMKRAIQILRLIKGRANGRLAHIEFTTQGFGEVSPVVCNTNDSNKQINRRVEFWIR